MNVKTKKTEQSEATRAALVAAARELFAERGFARTSTEELVRKARVTRGALYHHFEDKTDLFAAVFEDVSTDVMRIVAKKAKEGGPPGSWEHLIEGALGFLDASMEPDVQRIVLLDGPAVLGWQRWREIDERCSFGVMRKAMDVAIEAGIIDRQPVVPLAHMLMGALNEAALTLVRADDVDAARKEIGAGVTRLLEGLRSRD
jgi:AcrR family transcriptional regulator